MKTLVFAFLALALALAKPALAAPADNPNFPTHEQVQTMIDQAIDQIDSGLTADQVKALIATALADKKPAEPPFEMCVKDTHFYYPYDIDVEMGIIMHEPKEQWFLSADTVRYFSGFEGWGILYFPEGKIFGSNNIGGLQQNSIHFPLPENFSPQPGISVPAEIHCNYAGKSWDFNFIFSVPEKPTYTSTAQPINHGNYGNSSIPCIISDESKNDLFDGKYGKYDWLKKSIVQSDEDYYARYEDQNGYGIPWVSWQSGSREILTFDMKKETLLGSLQFHCYYREPDIFWPSKISVSFSNDGINFGNTIEAITQWHPGSDSANWLPLTLPNVNSRYFKVYMEIPAPGDLFIDEIMINGKDGLNYY